jgi:hypothetical protein
MVQTRLYARPTPITQMTQVELATAFRRRDDQLYAGIGMDVQPPLGPSRYLINAFDLTSNVTFILRPEVRLSVGAWLGVRRFGNGREIGDDPPIANVFCVRVLGRCTNHVDERLVPGFNQGTEFVRPTFLLRVDTRDSVFKPSSGAYAELYGDYTHGMADPSSFFRVGGSMMGVIDLWRRSHVLVLRAWAMTVLSTNDAPVPFSELVVLGGPDDLRGVRVGKYRDSSGVVFTAEYRWPVWMWMDAVLFADAGGVFGEWFHGFNVGKLVPDVGAGLRIRTHTAFYFRLQTAWSAADGWQFFIAATTVP